MAKKMSRKKVVAGGLSVLLAVTAGATGFGANYLVDFSLNPRACNGASSKMDIEGFLKPGLDADFAAEAKDWFSRDRKSVSLEAEDGAVLLGWEVCQDSGSHLYAVLCHGYIGEPADMAKYAYHYYQRGYNVLLPAARAHERNMGTGLIQMGWQDSKDLVGWVNQVVASDPEARIVLTGISMGGAEVMMASGWDLPSNVKAIVEDCGYTSVWDEFSVQLADMFHLPSFPVLSAASAMASARAGYNLKEASSVNQLKKATVPMLFIHGDADTFVPFSMLQQNFDACASEDKQMLVVEGAGHARCASTNPELYWGTIDAFVDARV